MSGYFQTDGTIGALSLSKITDFSISITDDDVNGGVTNMATPFIGSGLHLVFSATALVATTTDILFDFSSVGLFFAYTDTGDFWCVGGSGSGGCFIDNADVIGYSDTTNGYEEQTGYGGLTSIASVAAVPLPASLPLLAVSPLSAAAPRKRPSKAPDRAGPLCEGPCKGDCVTRAPVKRAPVKRARVTGARVTGARVKNDCVKQNGGAPVPSLSPFDLA